MDLTTSRNLGGVGAILIFIGPLGLFGTAFAGLLSLIGIILVLVALKGLADYYDESGIFDNALYGFIVGISRHCSFCRRSCGNSSCNTR